MSALKKQRPVQYSEHTDKGSGQEKLRAIKIHAEELREKLQRSILDNPKLSKKAAMIISLWIEGKKKKG